MEDFGTRSRDGRTDGTVGDIDALCVAAHGDVGLDTCGGGADGYVGECSCLARASHGDADNLWHCVGLFVCLGSGVYRIGEVSETSEIKIKR